MRGFDIKIPHKTKQLPTLFNEFKSLRKIKKIESLSPINQSRSYQPNKQNIIKIKDKIIP